MRVSLPLSTRALISIRATMTLFPETVHELSQRRAALARVRELFQLYFGSEVINYKTIVLLLSSEHENHTRHGDHDC